MCVPYLYIPRRHTVLALLVACAFLLEGCETPAVSLPFSTSHQAPIQAFDSPIHASAVPDSDIEVTRIVPLAADKVRVTIANTLGVWYDVTSVVGHRFLSSEAPILGRDALMPPHSSETLTLRLDSPTDTATLSFNPITLRTICLDIVTTYMSVVQNQVSPQAVARPDQIVAAADYLSQHLSVPALANSVTALRDLMHMPTPSDVARQGQVIVHSLFAALQSDRVRQVIVAALLQAGIIFVTKGALATAAERVMVSGEANVVESDGATLLETVRQRIGGSLRNARHWIVYQVKTAAIFTAGSVLVDLSHLGLEKVFAPAQSPAPITNLTFTYVPSTSPTVPVWANLGWQRTGMIVHAGTIVTIRRTAGLWSPWPGYHVDGRGCLNERVCGRASHDPDILCCMADGGLLGQIGTNKPFAVGNGITLRPHVAGMILLRINDRTLRDNGGSLIVNLRVRASSPATALPPTMAFLQVAMNRRGDVAARLRAHPSTGARVNRFVPAAAVVQVMTRPIRDRQGVDWYRASYKGTQGYILSAMLAVPRTLRLTTNVVNEGYIGVYMRASPSLGSTPVAVLGNGTSIRVLGLPFRDSDGQDWYKAIYGKKIGYVREAWLT